MPPIHALFSRNESFNLEIRKMNCLRKYFFIAWLSARSNTAYVGELCSRLCFMAIMLFIFLHLWKAAYAVNGTEQIGEFTLAQMLWYLTVTEAIMLSGPRVSLTVDEEVRTGAITMKLIRPMSYPLATMSNYLGERVVRFAFNLVIGSVVTIALVGPVNISPWNWIALALTLPLAFVIDFLCCFLIGLGAFWLEDTFGIFLIYSRLSMMLGGMLVPLEVFPNWCRPILEILPFPNIVWGPSHTFLKAEVGDVLALLLRQGFCVCALSLGINIVWRIALRRVFSNGG
jgi:ABC-2 type transport system permease protein